MNINEQIMSLVEQAAAAPKSEDAMRFSQAACNLGNIAASTTPTLDELARIIKSLNYEDIKYLANEVIYSPLRAYMDDLLEEGRDLNNIDFDLFATYLTEWADYYLDV